MAPPLEVMNKLIGFFQVYDNVGVKEPPQPNVSMDAAFKIGDTFVLYTVQDKAGLKANCTFKVTVNKLIKKGEWPCFALLSF